MSLPVEKSFEVFLRSFLVPVVLLVWVFLHLGAPSRVGAAEEAFPGLLDQKAMLQTVTGFWTINALRISYDHNQRTYEAEGDVHVHSGDQSLRADWASVNLETQKAELRGNVRLQDGQDWLVGNHVVWDLNEQTGTVDDGMVYFSTNRFYVQGQSIQKTGPSQYTLEKGYVTTCDPGKPDWKLRYGRMKVDLEGVAWVRDTSFWVRRLPLLYLPAMAFPVERERKSGLLLPWAGLSRLHGYEGEIPYYWAIREDMDATFYGRYMTERGFMGGVEYRVHNEKLGKGVWLFSYLHDQADKQHLAERGYPFQTSDRYWFRSRHTVDLSRDIRSRLDLDFVSDQNYLKEFERGSGSFEFSDRTFREMLGRGILNDQNLPARESSIYTDKRAEDWLLSLDVRYWDQLEPSLDEFTLQRLPSLSFQATPTWVMKSPLYYTLDSSLTQFWRAEGDRGNRMDAFPRLYWPLNWKSFVNVEPSLGGRFTGYHVDWDQNPSDPWQSRFVGDVQVDVSSRLNRVYPVEFGDHKAVQHAVRPEIRYVYRAEGKDQDHFPQFDEVDQNPFQHSLSYGLTNFLTSRKVSRDSQGNPVTSYHEFARLRLFQSFNIEPLPSDVRFIPETGRGFSTVGFRTDLMPAKHVTLTYDSLLYSSEEDESRHDLYLTLDSGKGHLVRFSYQQRRDQPVNELITETSLKITPSIHLSTYHDYSLDRDEMFKQGYGIRYVSGCWGVNLFYEKDKTDQRIAVSVNLLGLGGLGTKFSYGGDSGLGIP